MKKKRFFAGDSMSIAVTAAAALYAVSAAFLIVRFAKRNCRLFLKATISITAAFAVFIILKLVLWVFIPDFVMLLVILAVWIHLFLGYYIGLYIKSRVFDRLLHLFGSFSFALLAYYMTANISIGDPSKIFSALYTVGWGIALGGIFEIAEYFIDQKNGSHTQRGLKDTDFDLVFDAAGSLAAGLAMYFLIL